MWLHDGGGPGWPAKAARLARLARSGVAVPPGFVVPLGVAGDISAEVAAVLRLGPVIVRSALSDEDAADRSLAGLGLTVADRVGLADVTAALGEIAEHLEDPWLVRYRGRPRGVDYALVQHQVQRAWLVVAALTARGAYIEAHRGGGDVLAAGTSPTYAGTVAGFTAHRSALEGLFAQIRSALPEGDLDVEIVIDPAGAAHLVQVRPIVVDLDPGFDAFAAEVERQGQGDAMRGTLVLDAEHNPAPLSPAHAWLMEWLAGQRPGAGHPRVLAGWLYVETLVRDLAGPRRETQPPFSVLAQLRDSLIPAARARLDQIDASLRGADAAATAAALAPALDAFATMIDAYLGILVPARARGPAPRMSGLADDPLCLRERSRHADVLPAAWDVASSTLSEHDATFGEPSASPPLPTDPSLAAALLGEWDDHLFALGLAPVRRVYLRAATILGLGDDVFLLDGDELESALAGTDTATLRIARRAQQNRFAELRPPLRIEDGAPVPSPPSGRLRGIPIGPSVDGIIAQRRDVAHLLEVGAPAEAIVVLPALTAQAAVAIEAAGVRAVCCAYGGALSHAALMARELGLSALIGCRGCLEVADGAQARMDTRTGRLLVVGAG